eukprot:GHVQ01038870.1.p1 GENE.GHVQ01038870.1~~GHVQ01038870.1.p1  ORF type:complete len:202 (-),score=4.19 GHVQ01038870.1:19-624(-)
MLYCRCAYVSAPSMEHWQAAKHTLRYLAGTKNLYLEYKRTASSVLNIVGYCDADWATCKSTRRSVTGYCFMLESIGLISWCSKKQSTVALSTVEAEYMGISSACQEAIYLRSLLCELKWLHVSSGVTIFEDNQGCIALANNPVLQKRGKHIDIRYHFVRNLVSSKCIILKYVSTNEMIADSLTKSVPKPKVDFCRNHMLSV